MGSILKIENLKYKDILKNISLNIEENTFNVLLGTNGSGKTTLLKSIAHLIKYEGDIYFNDEIVNDSNILLFEKNIGICMDNNFLQNGSTIYNIIYPLLNLDYDEMSAKSKAYEISKKLDIDTILLKNVDELSLSERKLVSFARSIIHNPKVILIDDSFDELDNYYRNKIIKYLKSLKNKTIIFVSNNEEDVLLADNVIIINNGEIVSNKSLTDSLQDEKIFINNNIKLPFLADLSHKLKDYNLIDNVILDTKELVDAVWK